MGTGRALSVLLALLAPGAAPAGGSCRECHPAHHEALGDCTACHRGEPRSRRPEIAHHELIAGRFAHFAVPASPVVARGQGHVERAGCRRCHVTGGRGNGLASDLDRLLPRARPAETLAAIQAPALLMPQFAFPEGAAVEVVNALLAGSAAAAPRGGEAPQVVHFERASARQDPFEKHCGGCHRMLTRARGGLGAGVTGPNLSGLFSEFYPGVFKEGERWAPASLRKWVANPRASRPLAVMPPLRLSDEELEGVLSRFEPGGPPGQPRANHGGTP